MMLLLNSSYQIYKLCFLKFESNTTIRLKEIQVFGSHRPSLFSSPVVILACRSSKNPPIRVPGNDWAFQTAITNFTFYPIVKQFIVQLAQALFHNKVPALHLTKIMFPLLVTTFPDPSLHPSYTQIPSLPV